MVMTAVYLRMEIAAKKGEFDVNLFVLPFEVQELEKEGFSCKKVVGAFYNISWENVCGDLTLSQWKAICESEQFMTKAEQLAALTVQKLVA